MKLKVFGLLSLLLITAGIKTGNGCSGCNPRCCTIESSAVFVFAPQQPRELNNRQQRPRNQQADPVHFANNLGVVDQEQVFNTRVLEERRIEDDLVREARRIRYEAFHRRNLQIHDEVNETERFELAAQAERAHREWQQNRQNRDQAPSQPRRLPSVPSVYSNYSHD